MSQDDKKRRAAEAALLLVEPGMKLGLGTGSTAAIFVELLAERVRAGLDIIGVPTSEATRQQGERGGIRLVTLDEEPHLDLTIDGADELNDALQLIKGGGGALLREKIVASASDRMVVIADASKRVTTLGRFMLPIEVVQFGLRSTRGKVEAVMREAGAEGGLAVRVARDGSPYRTDSGNLILDCAFGVITDAPALASRLAAIPGVVEHGLFIDIARLAFIGTDTGVEQVVS